MDAGEARTVARTGPFTVAVVQRAPDGEPDAVVRNDVVGRASGLVEFDEQQPELNAVPEPDGEPEPRGESDVLFDLLDGQHDAE